MRGGGVRGKSNCVFVFDDSLCTFCNTIVRIEFSPVVEMGASNGHNLLQENSYEELTLSYA